MPRGDVLEKKHAKTNKQTETKQNSGLNDVQENTTQLIFSYLGQQHGLAVGQQSQPKSSDYSNLST